MDASVVLQFAFVKSTNPPLEKHQKLFLTPCRQRMVSKTTIREAGIITVLLTISYSTIKFN
jgi:hypothetical protein